MNVSALCDELKREIKELELEEVRIQARRGEKERLLVKLQESGEVGRMSTPSPRRGQVAGRHTIAALRVHHYQVGGMTFKTPGEVLDHLGVPHYFSKQSPKQGDSAVREILRWAKRDPAGARGVVVALADGTTMELHMAATRLWP